MSEDGLKGRNMSNWLSNNCTVGYATTNDATTKECCNPNFVTIKSGCYNEHRCYKERGGILSVDVARVCLGRFGPIIRKV
jgi:hypothetical protein